MAIKVLRPNTNGQRNTQKLSYDHLDKVKPCSALTTGLKKNGGRNNYGRITVRHKGGGSKRLYRIIDFKRNKLDIPAKVETLEYDPNRTAYIAKLLYLDGQRSYVVAASNMTKGQVLLSSDKLVDVVDGNSMLLRDLPLGTVVHNVELKPGKGAQIARSAGSRCQLVARNAGFAQLKMPSGEIRRVPELCRATVGVVSNLDHANRKLGKAGKKRHLGVRPTVRGVAMNPVDHPHGGGEGRTSGGRHPVSPWAVATKGFKTRKNKRTDKYIVKKRSK